MHHIVVHMTQNSVADGGTNSKEQTFAAIKERFDDADGNVEVTRDELKTLDVLEDYGMGDREKVHVNHDGPVVAKGSKDVDPVKYYLVRVSHDQWMALKYLYKLIDSDPQWYVTGIGDIQVDGIPLNGDFGDELDLADDAIDKLREAYARESEETFDYVDELWAAAFDGSKVYMELEEPWLGLDRVAEDIGIGEDVWQHEVRPAISKARPSNPRVLDTSLTTEFAVDVRFE